MKDGIRNEGGQGRGGGRKRVGIELSVLLSNEFVTLSVSKGARSARRSDSNGGSSREGHAACQMKSLAQINDQVNGPYMLDKVYDTVKV